VDIPGSRLMTTGGGNAGAARGCVGTIGLAPTRVPAGAVPGPGAVGAGTGAVAGLSGCRVARSTASRRFASRSTDCIVSQLVSADTSTVRRGVAIGPFNKTDA